MYYTYMLRCEDDSIYTGITTDLDRRFKQHQGKVQGGAKYTKSRMPLQYEMAWKSQDRQSASKLEYRLKRLTKQEKEALIKAPESFEKLLADKLDVSTYQLVNLL